MSHLNVCNSKVISFKESKVISKDGTTIGFQTIGEGPGIILIHGALRDSNDYTHLANSLSHSFTVHLMDRRGRGLSGPQGPNYDITKECKDVQTIQEVTGANYLIGHSFGGLVSLEVARMDSSITKIALYEPGVLIKPMDDTWMSHYEKAILRKDFFESFTHFVRGMGNTPLTRLPHWYAKLILRIIVRGDRWNKTAQLLPQNLNEHREVYRLASSYRNYRSIEADVLLIQGSESSNFTKEMMKELNQTITNSKIETISKLDHFGPENESNPGKVAHSLKNFFLKS